MQSKTKRSFLNSTVPVPVDSVLAIVCLLAAAALRDFDLWPSVRGGLLLAALVMMIHQAWRWLKTRFRGQDPEVTE